MSAITAKASRKMKKYAVLTREPRCFLGSFDFSWEQRKLGELVDVCSGRDYKHLSEGTIPVYGTGGYMLSVNDALSYDRDAIGIGRKGTIDRPYILKAPFWTVDTLFYAIPREKADLNFAFDIFQNIDWKKKDESTGVPSLSKTAINDIDVLAPKHGEQQTIGQFFAAIDHLITLHQRECISFTARAGRLILTANKKRNTSSWEQRKFSDITFPAGEKNKDNLPLESYSITNEHGFVPQDEKFENGGTMREADKRMYYIVSPNSFAYNPARINVGSIGYQNIGKNVIVSSLYEVFKTSEDVDDRLLWHWFKSSGFQKLIMQLQEGGVRLYFYYDKLCMGEVSLPSLDEQRKIGKLFDTLDNLITLHQRKFEKLTNVKKSMLEKMFPQNGSSYPEIRFKGFTDPWEQRKLGELGTITTGNTPSTSIPDYYSDDGIVWVTPTDICENITFESARKLSDLGQQVGRVVPKNTILVTCIASIGKNTMLGNTGSFNQQINGLTPNENKYDPYFLLTESALWSAKMKGSAASGTMQIVNRTEFSELKTWLPSLIEQQAIGAFFKQLDNLITLHQRELEKLQNIKKSMLEKMFV